MVSTVVPALMKVTDRPQGPGSAGKQQSVSGSDSWSSCEGACLVEPLSLSRDTTYSELYTGLHGMRYMPVTIEVLELIIDEKSTMPHSWLTWNQPQIQSHRVFDRTLD